MESNKVVEHIESGDGFFMKLLKVSASAVTGIFIGGIAGVVLKGLGIM